VAVQSLEHFVYMCNAKPSDWHSCFCSGTEDFTRHQSQLGARSSSTGHI